MALGGETLGGKVMVTGGAGYIGSHAVLALLDSGHDVVVIDNLVTGFDWAVDPRAAFVNIAVEDPGVRDVIRDHNVRAIMHFAGSVVVPESVENPLKYYSNNTAATRSLIESAVEEGVPHFIFSSTAATYGNPTKVPITESDPQAPINPYGMSKLMTEAMLRDVAAAHPMNYGALRYFNVAGADPQSRSGQSTVGATHLIKIAVEAATGKVLERYSTGDTPEGAGDASAHFFVNLSLDRAGQRLFAVVVALRQWGEGELFAPGEAHSDLVEKKTGKPLRRMAPVGESGNLLAPADTEVRKLPR